MHRHFPRVEFQAEFRSGGENRICRHNEGRPPAAGRYATRLGVGRQMLTTQPTVGGRVSTTPNESTSHRGQVTGDLLGDWDRASGLKNPRQNGCLPPVLRSRKGVDANTAPNRFNGLSCTKLGSTGRTYNYLSRSSHRFKEGYGISDSGSPPFRGFSKDISHKHHQYHSIVSPAPLWQRLYTYGGSKSPHWTHHATEV